MSQNYLVTSSILHIFIFHSRLTTYFYILFLCGAQIFNLVWALTRQICSHPLIEITHDLMFLLTWSVLVLYHEVLPPYDSIIFLFVPFLITLSFLCVRSTLYQVCHCSSYIICKHFFLYSTHPTSIGSTCPLTLFKDGMFFLWSSAYIALWLKYFFLNTELLHGSGTIHFRSCQLKPLY